MICRSRVAPASAANKFASLSSSPRPLVQWTVARKSLIGSRLDAAQMEAKTFFASGADRSSETDGAPLWPGPHRPLRPVGSVAGRRLLIGRQGHTRNLRGRTSGEGAHSAHSALRRLSAPSEPWSGLRPPDEETPNRKPAPLVGRD